VQRQRGRGKAAAVRPVPASLALLTACTRVGRRAWQHHVHNQHSNEVVAEYSEGLFRSTTRNGTSAGGLIPCGRTQ
jgi:hypothetical protein